MSEPFPPGTSRLVSLALPDTTIAYRCLGEGPPLLLLHATLSSSWQLRHLAARLAARFRVVSMDRRGSGESAMLPDRRPVPIDVAVHVADAAALIEAERLEGCLVVGHSYGGCLALELATRRPALVAATWTWEPPYAPLAGLAVRRQLAGIAERTLAAGERQGPAAAAAAFLAGVSGGTGGTVETHAPAAMERLARIGGAAIAEAPLLGLAPSGLAAIACPAVIAHGAASPAWYGEIAAALAARIPGAVTRAIPGADHLAPVTRPDLIAAAVEADADR